MHQIEIKFHHAKGDAEITEIKQIREHTEFKAYINADFVTDVANRRSVTSVVHQYNEVVFAWKIVKRGITHKRGRD